MRRQLYWCVFGAFSIALIGLLASAGPSPDGRPPHVDAGVSLYGLELANATGVLTGVGPTTEVKVLESRGSWCLVEHPNQPRGPQWVNFDQVVSYRTRR